MLLILATNSFCYGYVLLSYSSLSSTSDTGLIATVLAVLGTGLTTIFVDEAFIPFYESLKDNLKTNENPTGKFYRYINNRLANLLMRKEDKMTPPLKMMGDEYRIYNLKGKIHCRRSHIPELKQIGSTKFRGIIHRFNLTKNERSINDFRAHKKKNVDYLVIEEYKKGKKKESPYLSTAYYYFPDNLGSKEVVGIAIENHQAQVQQSISVLSFGDKARTYGDTSGVLKVIDKTYLEKLNININTSIIDETIHHTDQ